MGRREGGPPPTVVIPPRRRRHERHHLQPARSRPRPRSGRSRAQTGRSARRSVAPSRHRRPWRVRDQRIAREAARRTRTPLDAARLGHEVGRVIARHEPAPESHRGMAKHFRWTVHDGRLVHERDHARTDAEARLDGIYVLRTSEPAERLSPEDTVRTCKGLAGVERWFRTRSRGSASRRFAPCVRRPRRRASSPGSPGLRGNEDSGAGLPA